MLDPLNPYFWVLVSFVGFVALLVYYKVPEIIGKALDSRATAIQTELDEARRLREEAQALLNDYKTKAREAENEAKSIIEQAKREAEALASESNKALAESLERRSKMAEEKIARAEAQALSEVRSAAVDAALSAAEKIIAGKVTGATGSGLIDDAIKDLKGKLN
ncbi:MAG: F0F1 ATP synthase subunit B [Hyphomicrobiaceae bacterium]|nr:F0F1 ATP synthase subunit B [Hyphomicrobiaceae bacterium]